MGKSKTNPQNITLSFIDTLDKYSAEDLSSQERTYAPDKPVYWGIRNSYTNLIGNCYLQSPTLRACCQSFTDYVAGNGVQIMEAKKWSGEVNRYGETLDDIIAKMAQSYFLYGGWCIQVIYSKLYTLSEIYCVDFAKCRVNESKSEIYFFPKGCSTYGRYETYQRFDPAKVNENNLSQMAWYNGTTTATLYPSPNWTAAISDVLTEIETSKFSLSTISGGFMAKYIISLPDGGSLTEEQKKDIEEGIKAKFTGSDATSNFMLYFNGGLNNSKIEVSKIESDNSAESFLAIRDTAKNNIFSACRTSPLIMGLGQANTLSTNEFSDSFEVYNRTIIVPVQRKIERFFNRLFSVDNALKIKKFSINLED